MFLFGWGALWIGLLRSAKGLGLNRRHSTPKLLHDLGVGLGAPSKRPPHYAVGRDPGYDGSHARLNDNGGVHPHTFTVSLVAWFKATLCHRNHDSSSGLRKCKMTWLMQAIHASAIHMRSSLRCRAAHP